MVRAGTVVVVDRRDERPRSESVAILAGHDSWRGGALSHDSRDWTGASVNRHGVAIAPKGVDQCLHHILVGLARERELAWPRG